MLFDLSNPYDCERAKTRLQSLIASVELTERKQRSDPQNRYLHVCIGIVAMETGNTMDYITSRRIATQICLSPDATTHG